MFFLLMLLKGSVTKGVHSPHCTTRAENFYREDETRAVVVQLVSLCFGGGISNKEEKGKENMGCGAFSFFMPIPPRNIGHVNPILCNRLTLPTRVTSTTHHL